MILYSLRPKNTEKMSDIAFPSPLKNSIFNVPVNKRATVSVSSPIKILTMPNEDKVTESVSSTQVNERATESVSSTQVNERATESVSSTQVNERATESVSSNNVSKKSILAALGLGEKQLENLKKLSTSLVPSKNNSLKVLSNLDLRGKLTTSTLEVKNTSDFGTSSKRKISIVPSSYKNDGTYFAFFNGKKRTNYMIPRINGQLYNNGHLNCEGNIYATNINLRNKITGKTLEVKRGSEFGTSSKRKLTIEPTSFEDLGTFISFYNGEKRAGSMFPKKNGSLVYSGALVDTEIPGYARKSTLKNYLRNGSVFKFKATNKAYDGVVWSNSMLGKYSKERGLAARKDSTGDNFTITQVKN